MTAYGGLLFPQTNYVNSDKWYDLSCKIENISSYAKRVGKNLGENVTLEERHPGATVILKPRRALRP
jgi:hypothetical protein